RDFGITREQSDEFALASQQKYASAEKEGFYRGEIMTLALPAKKKDAPAEQMSADEHPRRDSTIEALAKLKPLFEGGVVTAGNASGVNDGAAALLIGSKKWSERWGRPAHHGRRASLCDPARPRARRVEARRDGDHRDQRGFREPGARL